MLFITHKAEAQHLDRVEMDLEKLQTNMPPKDIDAMLPAAVLIAMTLRICFAKTQKIIYLQR